MCRMRQPDLRYKDKLAREYLMAGLIYDHSLKICKPENIHKVTLNYVYTYYTKRKFYNRGQMTSYSR